MLFAKRWIAGSSRANDDEWFKTSGEPALVQGRSIAMSKGNDKKSKADKNKPKGGGSAYKLAQGKAAAPPTSLSKRIGVK
jgi:hypothetical protein